MSLILSILERVVSGQGEPEDGDRGEGRDHQRRRRQFDRVGPFREGENGVENGEQRLHGGDDCLGVWGLLLGHTPQGAGCSSIFSTSPATRVFPRGSKISTLDQLAHFQAADFLPLDAEQSRRFVEIFTPVVAAQIARFRLPHDLAQDALQESLLRALRGLARFRGDARLTTWMYTIAFREAVRVRERWSGARAHGAAPEGWDPEDPRAEERQHRAAADADELARVRAAMERLPDDQRLAIGYHYLDGLAVAEIAVLMRSTPNTVKSWLKRGRDALRGTLGVTEAEDSRHA
jgi:RNA polymerase sigma-70 factor (ECF subfamily)